MRRTGVPGPRQCLKVSTGREGSGEVGVFRKGPENGLFLEGVVEGLKAVLERKEAVGMGHRFLAVPPRELSVHGADLPVDLFRDLAEGVKDGKGSATLAAFP